MREDTTEELLERIRDQAKGHQADARCWQFIGIEQDPGYFEIAKKRILG